MNSGIEAAPESDFRRSVDAGEVIFDEGEVGTSAYMIESGRVEISLTRNGRKLVLANRGAGEVFGEMAILDDGPRSATAIAIEPSELIMITRDQVRSRITQADPVLRMYLDLLLKRFRSTLSALQTVSNGEFPESPHVGSVLEVEEQAGYQCAIREIKLERELREALHNNEFLLYFQPVIDLQSRRIAGFESLIRWKHPERGIVSPAEFLPTAESSGLITAIGRFVLKHSFEFFARLKSEAGSPIIDDVSFIAVNVSAGDVVDSGFVEHVVAVANATGVGPENVKLEITESVLLSRPDCAARTLNALTSEGFSICIDDFGTGYSSLGYLLKFPFDTLKIDRSFVHSMNRGPRPNRLVHSIVALAKELDLVVVAEGIETDVQDSAFRNLDCAFGQGYHYSRPIPECRVHPFMAAWGSA